jgi:hypothetical protein
MNTQAPFHLRPVSRARSSNDEAKAALREIINHLHALAEISIHNGAKITAPNIKELAFFIRKLPTCHCELKAFAEGRMKVKQKRHIEWRQKNARIKFSRDAQ